MADDDYTAGELEQAYGLAAKAGDSAAMQDLHSRRMAMIKPVESAVSDTPADNFVSGMGHAFQRGGEGLANLVGIKGKLGGFDTTDEGLKDEDKIAQPLLSTGAGKAGDIAGQVVESLPLGMGTGAGVRALTAARGPLAQTMARMAAAGGENALQSASYADPDEQGSAALSGAAAGGGLSLAGKVGGRLTRGLVEKSAAARELEQNAAAQGKDLFIPISQGADDSGLSGAIKGTYQHVLPYALGVEGKLGRQSEAAKETIRKVAALGDSDASFRDTVVGNTPAETASNLTNAQAGLRDKLGGSDVEIPSTFKQDIVKNLEAEHGTPDAMNQALAEKVDENVQLFAKDGKISAARLQEAIENAKDDLGKMGSKFRPKYQTTALSGAQNLMDEQIAKNEAVANNPPIPTVTRGTGGKFRATTAEEKAAPGVAASGKVADLTNLQEAEAKTPSIQGQAAAAETAIPNEGAYSMAQGAIKAPEGSANRRMFQKAYQVLDKEDPGSVSPAGRHLAHTVGGVGTLLGGIAHPGLLPAAGAGILGGNLLATRAAQRGLYGDSAAQKALADYIRRNPQAAYSLGQAGRTAVNASGQ
jgi:hypothetical protein